MARRVKGDPGERKHRYTWQNHQAVEAMANADFASNYSLSAAMGLARCVHGGTFPCKQCEANRRWNEAATGERLTDGEFERRYAAGNDAP